MGPKPTTRARNSKGRSRRGGGVSVAPKQNNGVTGIMVEDLLLEEAYDMYLNSVHSAKLTGSQFYCNIDEIDRLGFGFKNLLEFQNLGRFLGLKNSYDSSQVKAFYCVAERQEDKVSFVYPFKNNVVTLTHVRGSSLVGLGCDGIDVENDNAFTRYDKYGFVDRISKTCVGALEYSNFSDMQLKCADKILHWIIAKIIMCKKQNFGRIDDLDLRLMWLIKSRIKVNWPLFFCNRMISYKLDTSKKLS